MVCAQKKPPGILVLRCLEESVDVRSIANDTPSEWGYASSGWLISKFGWEWWMTCGVITGLLLTAIVSQYILKYDPERRKAWKTVETHLIETAKATEDAQDPSVKIVRAFFDRQRGNARAFAGDMLSWGGKWAYAKGLIFNGHTAVRSGVLS